MRHSARRLATTLTVLSLLTVGGVAAAQVRIIEREMPAPIVEVVPAVPGPTFKWVPGHWVWRGMEWFWVKGHYVEREVPPMPALIVETPPPAPSPNHFWVRGHYGWEDHRWNWHPGVWIRP